MTQFTREIEVTLKHETRCYVTGGWDDIIEETHTLRLESMGPELSCSITTGWDWSDFIDTQGRTAEQIAGDITYTLPLAEGEDDILQAVKDLLAAEASYTEPEQAKSA